jgi:hypothetical protein
MIWIIVMKNEQVNERKIWIFIIKNEEINE